MCSILFFTFYFLLYFRFCFSRLLIIQVSCSLVICCASRKHPAHIISKNYFRYHYLLSSNHDKKLSIISKLTPDENVGAIRNDLEQPNLQPTVTPQLEIIVYSKGEETN